MPRFLRRPAAVCAALLGACSRSSTAPETSLAVTPAASAFARGPAGSVRVPFTVANTGATPVGVVQCGARVNPSIERWQGGAWASYAGGFCLAIYPLVPVPLAPGAARADTAALAGVDAGRYRLAVALERGRVVSPAFDVQ